MSLQKYRQKRNFKDTTEPSSKDSSKIKKNKKKLLFVVQKHDASHLHYDFRLEVNGVLKSWAVPKGPSLSSKDKRLAIMVEDHPYDYHDFEGVIPKGNYGAGSVMVWDAGYYEPLDENDLPGDEKTIEKGLKKGGIHFNLYGKKLNGKFSLIKLKNSEKDNEWLLIKSNDSYETSSDVLKNDLSVLTERTMNEISSNLTRRKDKPKKKLTKLSSKKPGQIKPMLAHLVEEAFDNPDWLFELKWDGYRAIADVSNKNVKLYSRNFISFNERFSPIVEALKALQIKAIFDGEIVVINEKGKSDFQLLQNYQKTGIGDIRYVIFDLLYIDGEDLRNLPLIERKSRLKEILPKDHPLLFYSSHVLEKGKKLFAEIKKNHFEGVIAKRIESPYVSERSRDWLKIKTEGRQEAVICGFTEPKGSRKNIGALILGVYEKNNLKYIGHTGTGFAEKDLSDMHELLKPLIIKKCPFSIEPKTNTAVTWVKPKILCEVSFTEWTKDNQMRHPVFLGIRQDKKSSEVKKEEPLKEKQKTVVKKGKDSFPILTHLDKVYWPKEGFTKGDVINYYRSIASYILPYLKNRPQVLHRYPNGIEQAGFYHKNLENPPPEVRTVAIQHSQEEVNYLMIDDEKSLLYAANLGCIDFNPFSSRIQNLQNPDYMIIDLDPENISFDAVIEAALAFHQVFEEYNIPNYCKTSGATGMHILVPMKAKYTYEQVKEFAHLFAEIVHRKLPRTTSLERSPSKRQKRVYLDYLQNNFGQTIASVYSIRPQPGATVSTPLEWSEVKRGIRPTDYHIGNTLQRLKKVGDIFEPVLGKGIDILKTLKKLS